MLWDVTLSGKKFRVELPLSWSSGEILTFKINGQEKSGIWNASEQMLSIAEKGPNGPLTQFKVRSSIVEQFKGESERTVTAEFTGGGLGGAHYINAELSPYAPGQEGRAKKDQHKGAVIRSPITGKVIKVEAKLGDTVDAGQTLLIIEAMKMENKIFAKSGGKITAIKPKVGDMVAVGDQLVVIE